MKNTSPTNPKPLKTKLAFRFLKAMKKLNNKISPSMADKNKRYHAIRAAAYTSMASAVGYRKAWSRAILRKMIKKHKVIKERKRVRGNPGIDRFGEELNDLSGLVPGGNEMDSCKLLNETGHYIKCLRAQVQVMRKILDYSSP